MLPLSKSTRNKRKLLNRFLLASVVLVTLYLYTPLLDFLKVSSISPSATTASIISQNTFGTEYSKENATIVTLCRNEDLYSMLETIQNFEDRFNSKFGYTWTFLNNEPFTEEFKALTSNICSGSTKYGLIPEYQWSYPDRINLKKVKDARKKMANLPYGSLESYNHMCRYFSGFFYKHGLLNEFKYYWRVEPDVKLYCDIDYDVFKYMRVNKKKYGFSVSLFEEPATIGTLWPTIRTFLKSTGGAGVKKNNLMDFISIDNGQTYNTCHFWSNFEIGDMDFWRSKEYESFFQYLDESGGFFYERWGDAPIHTIGAALFLDASEFHFFEDVSYFHNPVLTCPENDDMRLKGKCSCDPSKDFNAHFYVSCMDNYFKALNQDLPKHWGQYLQLGEKPAFEQSKIYQRTQLLKSFQDRLLNGEEIEYEKAT